MTMEDMTWKNIRTQISARMAFSCDARSIMPTGYTDPQTVVMFPGSKEEFRLETKAERSETDMPSRDVMFSLTPILVYRLFLWLFLSEDDCKVDNQHFDGKQDAAEKKVFEAFIIPHTGTTPQ